MRPLAFLTALLLAAPVVHAAAIIGTEATKTASPAGTVAGQDIDVMADGSIIICWNHYTTAVQQTPMFARSTDAATWMPVQVSMDGAAAGGTDCALESVGTTILYANQQYLKVRQSTNGGATFSDSATLSTATCNPGSGSNVDLAVLSSTTWAVAYGGATKVCEWHTTDGGATYTSGQISATACSSEYFAIAYGLNANSLLAVCDDALWRTTNGGTTWSQIPEATAFSGADLTDFGLTSQPGQSDTFTLYGVRSPGINGGLADLFAGTYNNTPATGTAGPLVTPATGAGAAGRVRAAQGPTSGLFYQEATGSACNCWKLSYNGQGVSLPADVPINVDARFAVNGLDVYAIYTEANAVTFFHGVLDPQANAVLVWGEEPIFCSARGNARFGYNYAEDVERYDAPFFDLATGIEAGYLFQGHPDNFAYLGAMLNPQPAAQVRFKIETAHDSVDSLFRVVFSFIDHTPYIVDEPGVPDAEKVYWLNDEAKGNGKTSGVFDRAIEVQFKEAGNDWSIQLYYVEPGGGRTQLGKAWLGGTPNKPTAYSFTVDARSSEMKVTVKYANGDRIGVGSLENRTLPPSFADQSIRGQWFVGYAADSFANDFVEFQTGGLSHTWAETHLEDKSKATASTCIYGLVQQGNPSAGPAVGGKVGDPGAGGPLLNSSNPTGAAQGITDANDPETSTAEQVDTGDWLAGASSQVKLWVGLALLLGFILLGRRKFGLDPETTKLGVLVFWIILTWLDILQMKMLIAAGIIGVIFYGKQIAKVFG